MHFDFLIPVMDPEGETPYLGGIARRLQARGCSVGMISMTHRPHPACLAVTPHVFAAYANLDPRAPVHAEDVAYYERKYQLGSIDDHVGVERVYDWSDRDWTSLYRRTVLGFRFLEGLLTKHTVSFFVNAIGGEVMRRCMARLADCGGPTNLIIDWTPLPGRIVVTTLETGWDELRRPPPSPSDADRTMAADFVERFTRARKPFAGPSTLGLGWQHVRRAGARAFGERLVGVSFARLGYERAQRVVRRTFNRSLYEPVREGEQFFFFPLHQPNDAALTLRAPQFLQQEVLIEFIADRLLPHGTKLYVKPHVGARDSFSIPSLLRIARTRNVRLVDPTLNAHDLATQADAVLVINSTVGFESLCHGRPTVVFGRPFYRGFGLTQDVDNLLDAPAAVRRAMERPPDRDALLRFLAEAFRVTAPGVCGEPTDENVERTARAILEKAARMGRAVGTTPKDARDYAG